MSNERFAFRVWDKEEKRYVAHHGLRDTYNVSYNVSLYHFENPNRYEIEEWTGMIDCKGNKIYEGDIVDANGKKGKVVWNNALSCYELIDVNARTVFCENKKRDILVFGNVKERNDTLFKENERLKKELENIKAELKTFRDKYNGSESWD